MAVVLKGTKREDVDVTISEWDVVKEACAIVRRMYGVNDKYIMDGVLCEDEDCGPHRPTTRKLGYATPEQQEAHEVTKKLWALFIASKE